MWLISAFPVAGNLPLRLELGEYIVGRTTDADIVLKDRTLSRRHARLIRSARSLIVEDLNSLNGTFVNGERATRSSGDIGDEIRFGGVMCRLAASPLSTSGVLDGESTLLTRIAADSTVEFEGLTPAQHEVLGLVLQGLDETAIARRLNRSAHTVHTHLKAIFRQVGVHSRAELIVKFVNSAKS